MSEPLSPPPMNGIPMFRNDSEESTESPFGSVLNTPSDEHASQFDSIDTKLLSAAVPQALERLENHVRGRRDIDAPAKSPRRVSLSRNFSKALEAANKSTSSNGLLFRARSNSVERVFYLEDSASPSPDLVSLSPAEVPPQPIERVQTPEPPLSDAYATSSPQSIFRTSRPPLSRRNIFSPASVPVELGVGNESASSVEFTPRAHSTLRNRRGAFMLLNDSITGEPTSVASEATSADQSALNEVLSRDDFLKTDCEDDEDDSDQSELNAAALPQLSLFFPLQLVLFPAWCALVGAAILLCPNHLNAIAFPASTMAARIDTNTASPSMRAHVLALSQTLLLHCLPFSAPPSDIRVLAHWATVAHLHIAIFFAALGGILYLYPPLGALLAVGTAGRSVCAWSDFCFTQENDGAMEAELGGGDARKMLHQVLLAPGCGFEDGDAVRRVGEKYFLVHKPRDEAEMRREMLKAAGVEDSCGSGSDEDA
ncbi:hypothetical protein DFH08DRAFT_1084276 [Mycena albidolilacea]|uniref:Uncharacterized protein n=1 Tax=Mycena albidolilacea TaxID=1033008 RepID=A0AAD6ZMQ6_9AGAR|nr:hypothetical protein DFH08DRAFT_1084276 [Mycena albidolilacea]